jgi:hypothetical protein
MAKMMKQIVKVRPFKKSWNFDEEGPNIFSQFLMEHNTLKNVDNCLHTKIAICLKTSLVNVIKLLTTVTENTVSCEFP